MSWKLLVGMSLLCVSVAGFAAEIDGYFTVGLGAPLHVDKIGYGSAEWGSAEVGRVGYWTPEQRYLLSVTWIPDNDRKGQRIPETGYASVQRVFNLRRWQPYVYFFGTGLSLATRTTPLQGSIANLANSIGVRREINGGRWFWELSYHHWSNATLAKPNFGVDVVSLQFGWR